MDNDSHIIFQKYLTEAMDLPPPQVHMPEIQDIQLTKFFKPSSTLVDYLKMTENSIKKNFKNGRWYPHKSIEGGSPTIAYGHKLKRGEDFSQGLTDEEAHDLLLWDIEDAWHRADRDLDRMYGIGMRLLPPQIQEMLVDFSFNIGTITKFPKFVKSLIEGDKDTAYKEYQRRGVGSRNDVFRQTFLDRYFN